MAFTTKKGFKGSLLALLLLLLAVCGSWKPSAVQAASDTCKVTFDSNKGGSTARGYQILGKKVKKGTIITLPEVPKAKGCQSIGWTTTQGGTKPLYKAGTSIQIRKNTKFYAVRRKSTYYTVSFFLGDGSANKTYKQLKMRVEEGTSAKLPAVPARVGYKNLGWSRTKNSSTVTNKNKSTITPKRNYKFYAVQEKAVTLALYNSNGTKLFRSIAVDPGTSVKLPALKNSQNKTMIGWSAKKNQRTNPQYEVAETIVVNRTTRLYAVVYNRSAEPDLSRKQLKRWRSGVFETFDNVIFVGDSRTHHLELTLERQFGDAVTKNIYFVCKSRSELSWLREEGIYEIQKLLKGWKGKKTAIIFNHGINDVPHINSYVSYMKEIAPALEEKGCTLFYMSLNPINSKMSRGKKRTEDIVRAFNDTIRRQLCSGSGAYTYIDCYRYLIRNGYSLDRNGLGFDRGWDDGLHYATKTYKRIFDFCMHQLYNYGNILIED